MSFSGRKTYRLGEIATFYNGRAYKNEEFLLTGTPIVRIQNLTGEGKTVFSDLNLEPNKYIDKGDLIYAWSATFGPYLWKGEKSIYHYHIWKIECKENLLDKYYFYYTLKHISDRLKSGGNGTLFVHITKGFMESFEIDIPNISIQRKTASILSSLDDAIELNQQINKTLEEMAKAIFKEWFVDFNFPNSTGKFLETEIGKIPVGWKVGKLNEVLEIKYGKDHKHLESGEIPVYGSGGIMRYADKALYEFESILIPRKGTLSNLFYINKPFWSVDTMFYTKFKLANSGKYLFHLLQSLNLATMNVGSAVPSLTTEVLNNIQIAIPTKEVLLKFEEVVSSLFEQIEQNIEENQSLINLRDTLLPKLMKGEIEV